MIDNLSPETKSILKEIKFISSCPKEKKISFSLRKYTDSDMWSWDGFKKMLAFETYVSVLAHIETVLENVEDQLKLNEVQKEPILSLFKSYLEEMQIGLGNLKETYKNEPDASSQISVILDQLKLIITNIDTKLIELNIQPNTNDRINDRTKNNNKEK